MALDALPTTKVTAAPPPTASVPLQPARPSAATYLARVTAEALRNIRHDSSSVVDDTPEPQPTHNNVSDTVSEQQRTTQQRSNGNNDGSNANNNNDDDEQTESDERQKRLTPASHKKRKRVVRAATSASDATSTTDAANSTSKRNAKTRITTPNNAAAAHASPLKRTQRELRAMRSSAASGSTTSATAGAATAARRRSVDPTATAVLSSSSKSKSDPGLLEAFAATQAFVSVRDFFVHEPSGDDDDNPSALTATKTTNSTTTNNHNSSSSHTSADSRHVACTLCQSTLKDRAYSLKRHVFRHHRELLRLASDECTSSSSDVLDTRYFGISDTNHSDDTTHIGSNATEHIGSSKNVDTSTATNNDVADSVELVVTSRHKHSTPALVRVTDAYTQWLQTDVVPLSALASRHFQAFVRELNRAFVVPDVCVQPQQQQPTHDATRASRDTSISTSDSSPTRVMRGVWLDSTGTTTTDSAITTATDKRLLAPPTLRLDVPVPLPRAGEALVRVLRAGICGTDLHMLRAYKPTFTGVLGHEFVGIVEQLGPLAGACSEIGTKFDTTFKSDTTTDTKSADDDAMRTKWLGQRVVGEINVPCDACSTCRSGLDANASDRARVRRRSHCPQRQALGIVGKHGAFAEFLTLPLANLHVVPPNVADAHAVFAEPLAAACRVVEQHAVARGDRVAVLGDGKLGLLVAEVLSAQRIARDVTLVGRHAAKLALVQSVVTHTQMVAATNIAATDGTATNIDIGTNPSIAALTGAFDVCIDCTGSPAGATLALQLLRSNGTLVMKSTCAATQTPVDWSLVSTKAARVVGSRCGPIDVALAMLRDNVVDVQKLIAGVYPLSRVDAAIAHATQRSALKIQLVMHV